jgi:acid phosphatase (class A)
MSTRFGFIKNWQIGLALIGVGMIVGCAGFQKQSPDPVPEIMPGILVGYLDPATLPNSLDLVPPPPAAGSAALALDEEVSRRNLALHGTPRWDLAANDAELMFPEAAGTFSCALGIPITESDTPHIYMLLRRTLADAGLSTYTAKNHYQRQRPFMVNNAPICTPEEEEKLRKDGSYPSGHTAIGWAWALSLPRLHRTGRMPFWPAAGPSARAGWSATSTGTATWSQGRFMGAAAVARLHADPAFRAELEAAISELAAARRGGYTPPGDCQVETEALATDLFQKQ